MKESKLPTAKKVLAEYFDAENRVDEKVICMAIESHTQAHTEGLRERLNKLETENTDLYLKVKNLEFIETVDGDCIDNQSNEIDELKAWKESALRELNAIDLQSLGKKLCIGLGQSVSENVHSKVDGLLERVKELEAAAQQFVKAVENEEIIIQENYDNDGYENCGNRIYQAFKEALK